MIANRSIILPTSDCKVHSPTVNQQSVPVPLELLALADVAAECPFSPYPMDWNFETRPKGIDKEPKPKPMQKSRARPKNELFGNAFRSAILKAGKVPKGAHLEVYPKKGVKARWFVRVENGKIIWDKKGVPLISVIRWCKENTTELDAAFLPESCPLGWVMRRVLK